MQEATIGEQTVSRREDRARIEGPVARPAVSRLTRAGAVFFLLWGLVHMVVALAGILGAVRSGATGVLSAATGATLPAQPDHVLGLAGAIALCLSIDLAAFAALGVWVGVMVWRGRQMGFWLGAVILGTADAAFVVALIFPGHVSVANGFLGPLLYVLAVAFSATGLFGRRDRSVALMAHTSHIRA